MHFLVRQKNFLVPNLMLKGPHFVTAEPRVIWVCAGALWA